VPDSVPNIQQLSPAGIQLAYPAFGLGAIWDSNDSGTGIQIVSDPFGGPYICAIAFSGYLLNAGTVTTTLAVDGSPAASESTPILFTSEHRTQRLLAAPGFQFLGANNPVVPQIQNKAGLGFHRDGGDYNNGIAIPNVHGNHRVITRDNAPAFGVKDQVELKIGATGQYLLIFCPVAQVNNGPISDVAMQLVIDGVVNATSFFTFNRNGDPHAMCPSPVVATLANGSHTIEAQPVSGGTQLLGWTLLVLYDPAGDAVALAGNGGSIPYLAGAAHFYSSITLTTAIAFAGYTGFASGGGIQYRDDWHIGNPAGAFGTWASNNYTINPVSVHTMAPISIGTLKVGLGNAFWVEPVFQSGGALNITVTDYWFYAHLTAHAPYVG
jgi:hypothetical protein